MKIIKTGMILMVVLFIAGLSSCDLFVSFFGTTIDERVDSFRDDVDDAQLSQDYSDLYTHFHSDTIDRDLMKNDPNGDTGYWSDLPFYHDTGDNISTYSVSGTSVSGSMESPNSFTMEMKKEGLNYMIYHIDIDGAPIVRKIE